MTISTLSSSASSSSQAEALKNARGLRAITFTLFAPRRSEVRQQSIAVLPTPMISTRSPIFSMCPKATDSSQAMPMWMLAAPSWRPGRFSSLPFGAPEPTNTASNPPLSSSSRRLSMGWLSLRSTPMSEDHVHLFVQHRVRQAERGDVGAHEPAGLAELLEDRDFVAERHQVVGHGERGAAGADAGDALAVLELRDLRQQRR